MDRINKKYIQAECCVLSWRKIIKQYWRDGFYIKILPNRKCAAASEKAQKLKLDSQIEQKVLEDDTEMSVTFLEKWNKLGRSC